MGHNTGAWHKKKSRCTSTSSKAIKRAREKLQEKKRAAAVVVQPQPGSSQNPSSANVDTPKGRTAKKLNLTKESNPPRKDSVKEDEFLIVNTEPLGKLFGAFECPECKTKSLGLNLTDRHGFAAKLQVKCADCDSVVIEKYSSSREPDQDKSRPPFEVNKLMVSGCLSVGLGFSGMSRLSAAVGIHPMTSSTYADHLKKLSEKTEDLKLKILTQSRNAVRQAYEDIDVTNKNKEILDIAVSCDGSWHKRGHTSLYGLVCVVDIITGLVVDFIILSKFCHMCAVAEVELDKDSPEFGIWYESHSTSGECSKNYTGSSGGMEAEGAVHLWQRSEKEASMRYLTMLGDGDAKTFSEVCKCQPYGPGVVIQKEECINHVSKRMGTGLRNLVSDEKKVGNTLGGRAEGSLKDATIKALQGYYHHELISNIPNIQKMRNGINATLEHCASTDEKSNHSLCPKGSDSWCFFNKAKAKGEKKPSGHKKMAVKLNSKVYKALKPLYKRLSSDELLSRCTRGGTQNSNEALHSVIWRKCPKQTFVSKNRMNIAVTEAVGEWNLGCSALLFLKLDTPNLQAKVIAERIDKKRIQQSEKQADPAFKKRRIAAKKKKTQATKLVEKGPKKYIPGGGD